MEEDGSIEYRYGNPLDLFTLKQNVQRNYREQLAFWKEKAERLRADAKPVEKCLLCDSTRYQVVGHVHGWPWHQCDDCTHAYNGLRLPDEKYLEFYQITDEAINYSDTYTDAEVQDYRREKVATPKVDHIVHYAADKRGRWLDVATGNGDVVSIAKERGFQAKGVEINPAAVEYGRKKWGIDIWLGKIEDFEKEADTQWDVVSFLGISDIIVNPVEYIEIAHRLLRDGGIMAMSFPNFNSLSRYTQHTYHDQVTMRFNYPSVISSFTEKSAVRIIEKTGFSVESIWYFGMDMYELINNLSLSDERFGDSPVARLLREKLNELQLVFDKSKMGDEFLVIARK